MCLINAYKHFKVSVNDDNLYVHFDLPISKSKNVNTTDGQLFFFQLCHMKLIREDGR